MGNVAAADGVLEAVAAADLLAVEVVSLVVAAQPARAAAQVAAMPKVAAERRGILTEVTSSRWGGKEGEAAGAP